MHTLQTTQSQLINTSHHRIDKCTRPYRIIAVIKKSKHAYIKNTVSSYLIIMHLYSFRSSSIFHRPLKFSGASYFCSSWKLRHAPTAEGLVIAVRVAVERKWVVIQNTAVRQGIAVPYTTGGGKKKQHTAEIS